MAQGVRFRQKDIFLPGREKTFDGVVATVHAQKFEEPVLVGGPKYVVALWLIWNIFNDFKFASSHLIFSKKPRTSEEAVFLKVTETLSFTANSLNVAKLSRAWTSTSECFPSLVKILRSYSRPFC